MSNKLFTEEEMKILAQNQYVRLDSKKSIMYTDEFKREFIAENEKGKLPRGIFEEHGFDINLLGMDRVHSASKRWRAAYKEKVYLVL
jgi:transposase